MEPSNWQTGLSSIRERNEYAFNNSLFFDVEFSVQDQNGDKVTIPANKYVLAISSPVFEAMFYGELAESKSTIELPDCTKEGLRELLRYIYSDKITLTGSTCMEVLYLAEKYMMPFLVKKCKTFLQNEVGPDDVLCVLPQVQKIGDEMLQKHMWDIVDSLSHETLSSESFRSISQELLCQILQREALNIDELELFCAVDSWAEEKISEKGLDNNGETKRSIFGKEIIRLIRFPVMKLKEFAEVVLPLEILNLQEVTEVVQCFGNLTTATNTFINKKRCVNKSLLIPDQRFDRIESPSKKIGKWHYHSGFVDALDFTTNVAVDLLGVRMFGSHGSKYEVKLKIYKGNEVLSQLSSSFLSEKEMIDGLYCGFTINLDKPVRLEPRVVYTIEAQVKGKLSYYGEMGNPVMAVDNVLITYIDSSKSENGTTSDRGQFPTLVFKKFQ